MTDRIPPATLAEIGETIFGRSWQRPLAAAVGVNERTVRRWATDGAPEHVKQALVPVARKSEKRLQRVMELLKGKD